MAERLILLGVDGLDAALLAPLLRAGLMPHLAGLMARGVHGPLTPVLADCPPACWSTLMTGCWPDQHRVLTAQVADDVLGGVKPADSNSLQAPALWDFWHSAGLDSFRVGLPVNHPALGPGVCVSGAYPGEFRPGGRWSPLPDGTLHGLDAQARALLDELRVHPGDIGADLIAPLVPELARIVVRRDRRPALVGVALARTLSLHNAATWLLENQPQASGLIRYPLLDELSRHFLAYHPPRPAAVAEDDHALYRGVLSGAYRLLDMLVGRIIELAGPQAALMLISSHGFRLEPELRAGALGQARRPAPTIRPEGQWFMQGPGLPANPASLVATALDILPTCLAASGLAAPADAVGRSLWPAVRPLRNAPQRQFKLAHADPPKIQPEQAQVAAWLAQLADIGLPDPLAPQLGQQRAQLDADRSWAHYRILTQRGQTDAALKCLDSLRNGPRALLARLEQAGILGARAHWKQAAALLAPLLPLLQDADEDRLRQAGLPLDLVSLAAYRHGIQAILARGREDWAGAAGHLEMLGKVPLAIPCLNLLREELRSH